MDGLIKQALAEIDSINDDVFRAHSFEALSEIAHGKGRREQAEG